MNRTIANSLKVLALLLLAFCATPAGAHVISVTLACLPQGSDAMIPSGDIDSTQELPGGG